MSSLRLIVTSLVGSTVGGKHGLSTMWYSPWNLSTTLKHFGILTDHVLLVFFIGYFLQAVSLQGVVTFS